MSVWDSVLSFSEVNVELKQSPVHNSPLRFLFSLMGQVHLGNQISIWIRPSNVSFHPPSCFWEKSNKLVSDRKITVLVHLFKWQSRTLPPTLFSEMNRPPAHQVDLFSLININARHIELSVGHNIQIFRILINIMYKLLSLMMPEVFSERVWGYVCESACK